MLDLLKIDFSNIIRVGYTAIGVFYAYKVKLGNFYRVPAMMNINDKWHVIDYTNSALSLSALCMSLAKNKQNDDIAKRICRNARYYCVNNTTVEHVNSILDQQQTIITKFNVLLNTLRQVELVKYM